MASFNGVINYKTSSSEYSNITRPLTSRKTKYAEYIEDNDKRQSNRENTKETS